MSSRSSAGTRTLHLVLLHAADVDEAVAGHHLLQEHEQELARQGDVAEAHVSHGLGRRLAQAVQDGADEGLGLVEAAGREQPGQALLAVSFAENGGQRFADDDRLAVAPEEVDETILDEADVEFALRDGRRLPARPDARFGIHVCAPFRSKGPATECNRSRPPGPHGNPGRCLGRAGGDRVEYRRHGRAPP
jgi:hypothetical protein